MIKTTIALRALAVAATGSPALTQTRAQIMSPQGRVTQKRVSSPGGARRADLIGVYFATQADRHKPGAIKIDAGPSPLGSGAAHAAVFTWSARYLKPAT